MREGKFPGPLGGENKSVEVDETYIGGKAKNRAYREPRSKERVVALVERDGNVRVFPRCERDGQDVEADHSQAH
jgi:hypothetical protein